MDNVIEVMSDITTEEGGYLFVTFTDGREDGEQVYFAISRDGLHYTDLNDGNPVLISDIGEINESNQIVG